MGKIKTLMKVATAATTVAAVGVAVYRVANEIINERERKRNNVDDIDWDDECPVDCHHCIRLVRCDGCQCAVCEMEDDTNLFDDEDDEDDILDEEDDLLSDEDDILDDEDSLLDEEDDELFDIDEYVEDIDTILDDEEDNDGIEYAGNEELFHTDIKVAAPKKSDYADGEELFENLGTALPEEPVYEGDEAFFDEELEAAMPEGATFSGDETFFDEEATRETDAKASKEVKAKPSASSFELFKNAGIPDDVMNNVIAELNSLVAQSKHIIMTANHKIQQEIARHEQTLSEQKAMKDLDAYAKLLNKFDNDPKKLQEWLAVNYNYPYAEILKDVQSAEAAEA